MKPVNITEPAVPPKQQVSCMHTVVYILVSIFDGKMYRNFLPTMALAH